MCGGKVGVNGRVQVGVGVASGIVGLVAPVGIGVESNSISGMAGALGLGGNVKEGIGVARGVRVGISVGDDVGVVDGPG